jgi:hypothetical protein
MLNFSVDEKFFFENQTEFIGAYRSLFEDGNFSVNKSGVITNCTNCSTIMVNKTLAFWTDALKNYSENVVYGKDNLNITPLYSTLILQQTEPFYVDVSLSFNVSLESADFNFSDTNYLVSTRVSIINLTDPLFAYHSDGKYLKKIIQDPDYYSQVKNWTTEKINDSINQGYYFRLEDRPGQTFLMRLTNKSTYDEYNSPEAKFESFIDPRLVFDNASSPLATYNVSASKRSFVDHHFFNNSFVACDTAVEPEYYLYNISNISDSVDYQGFRLDYDSAYDFLQSESSWTNFITTTCSNWTGP